MLSAAAAARASPVRPAQGIRPEAVQRQAVAVPGPCGWRATDGSFVHRRAIPAAQRPVARL